MLIFPIGQGLLLFLLFFFPLQLLLQDCYACFDFFSFIVRDLYKTTVPFRLS